jgi:hypothetical protein
MVGRLVIGKNNSFCRITKPLEIINIRGNFNKIMIPFKIRCLTIYGNYNKIEVLEGGEINFIRILGNNNKIYTPNPSMRNYNDRGLFNLLIKSFYSTNRNRRLRSNRNHDNNNSNTSSNLEEKLYLEIPDDLKLDNPNKCSLCDNIFLNFDRVKIFSCEKHIFHSGCLEKYIRSNINSSRCPRCENNNNLNESTNTNLHLNSRANSINNMENNSNNNHNNNLNNSNNNNDMSEENENNNMDDDEDEYLDSESLHEKPLDIAIFDNLVVAKIKDVEKLDNEKKQCAICLENYVNGDESIALPCIHIFHANCIKTWLRSHNNCPSCKREIKYEMEDFENDEL